MACYSVIEQVFLPDRKEMGHKKMEITEIKVGMRHEARETVTENKTAKSMGSGSLMVYATPAMCCLMEKAAAELAEKLLPAEWTTVGGSISINHRAPTPIGAEVRAEAEVIAVEGRRIVYSVKACDEMGLIGEGEHERFAVGKEKFISKALSRRH